jgi:hypothetical protein
LEVRDIEFTQQNLHTWQMNSPQDSKAQESGTFLLNTPPADPNLAVFLLPFLFPGISDTETLLSSSLDDGPYSCSLWELDLKTLDKPLGLFDFAKDLSSLALEFSTLLKSYNETMRPSRLHPQLVARSVA